MAFGVSCIELAGQQDGNLGAEALEHDGGNNSVTTVPGASDLAGWHKMQCSRKELGLREPLEGKLKDPRHLGFIHCCIKAWKESKQSRKA